MFLWSLDIRKYFDEYMVSRKLLWTFFDHCDFDKQFTVAS